MKKILLLYTLLLAITYTYSQTDVYNKSDFYKQTVVYRNHPNAELIVRVGDVDNLGFGWEESFDPFCGMNTYSHGFPWEVDENDYLGTDRIMLGSGYKQDKESDGYTSTTDRQNTKPIPIKIDIPLGSITIKDVLVQMFVDDFQAPIWGSYFQFAIDNKRLTYVENIFNSLNQTGPIGKMITFGILPEDIKSFQDGKIEFSIDDPLTGAGDGFAIDFIQLLINPGDKYVCYGNIKGIVKDELGKPIENTNISINGLKTLTTDQMGKFAVSSIPIGITSVIAEKVGYEQNTVSFELEREEDKLLEIVLKKKKESNSYISEALQKRGSINLYGIYFDTASDIPKPDSKPTLEALVNALKVSDYKIKIIGHTDSDGSDLSNLDLSKRRANSIVNYLLSAGIDKSRLSFDGLGESSPVASNLTNEGKALNRRVEIIKL